MRKFYVAAACVVAALCFGNAVHAQTDYDTDGVTIGNLTGDARVGFNTKTPITVYTNGGTNVNVHLDVYNNATLDANGGAIGAFVTSHNNSTVNFNGGVVDYLLAAQDSSTVNLDAGFAANYATAGDNATFNFIFGKIQLDLTGSGKGVINIGGGVAVSGTVGRDAIASQSSTIALSKGGIGGDVTAQDNGTVLWTGGTIGGSLFALSSGVIKIYGIGLTSTRSGVNGNNNLYTLSGLLSDKTDITGTILEVEDNNMASYQLINDSGGSPVVPEPGAIAFGCIAAGGVLGMIARKRRRGAGVVSAVAAMIIVGAAAANAQDTAYNNDGDNIGTVVGDAIVGDAPVNPPITVYANGATIVLGGVDVFNDSIFEMDAGIVSDIFAFDTSVVNVRGGKTGDLFAFNSSQYFLFGSGLSATLVDPNDGQFVKYSLSGHLSDGGDLAQTSLYIHSGSVATFKLVEVPEPSAVAFGVLAAGSVVGLLARKRKV